MRQAAPDPEKAARDGVANYIPARSQVNLNFTCADCDRTAKWEVEADGAKLYACDYHRREYTATAGVYQERKIR